VGRSGKGWRKLWGGQKVMEGLWGSRGRGVGPVGRSGKGWKVCEKGRERGEVSVRGGERPLGRSGVLV